MRLSRKIGPSLAMALLGLVPACAAGPPTPPSVSTPAASASANAASPTPTPRVLTLEDLAPGLQPTQKVFANPKPPVTEPGPEVTLTFAAAAGEHRSDHPNVGLSFEARDLADPRWDPESSYLDELVGALDKPSLRFGGNSVDRKVWWTSTMEPAPAWADTTVSPADFERLGKFVTKTGASVTLVADLGHNDPARGADFVFNARKYLGDRLVAVSIGNEPNGFALGSQPERQIRPDGYSPNDFIAEARPYVTAIHELVPGVGIAGPGTFDPPWWRAFGDAKLPNTVAMSQHWYPLWSCDGTTGANAAPTVANITSPWLHDRAAFILGMGLQTADRYQLPLWLEETGPTSCSGGNETSRTHAQALWTADFTLHGASLGVRRMNHHSMIDSCKGGAPMSPLCDTGSLGSKSPELRGQANYLALLQLARLREGTFREVSVTGDDRVHAYAVQDDSGIDVMVVNMNDPAAVGASPLLLKAPEGYTLTHASVLHADSLAVRNGTSLIPWSPTSAMPDAVNAGSVLALRLTKS